MKYKRIRCKSFKDAVRKFDNKNPNLIRTKLSHRYNMRHRYYVNVYYKEPEKIERCWIVHLRCSYNKKKGKSDMYIEAEVYIRANTKEDAEYLAYQRILNFFDRDEEYFIPFDEFRIEALRVSCSMMRKKGVIKWKHEKQKRYKQMTLSSWI